MAQQRSKPLADDSRTGDKAAPKPGHVPPERQAWRSPLAWIVFAAIAVAGAAGDLASKHFVFESFLSNPDLPRRIQDVRAARMSAGMDASTRAVLHDAELTSLLQRQVMPGMKFTLSTNPGIVFGATMIPRWLVNVATALTIGFVILFFATSDRRAWLTHFGLASIIGGAVGNLYDRLLGYVQLPGGLEPIRNQVRDFIDASDIGYVWVFNVADALLVAGVLAIMLSWIISARSAKSRKTAT